MNGIINAISAFAQWVLSLVVKAFAALFDLLGDVLLACVDGFLHAIAVLYVAIPAPTFLQGSSLQSLFGGISPDVLYFFGVFNIGPGITLLGAGFGFRMMRKIVTLFQW